jgi:16S rRNA (cytosine967-C5)-methyltransferase
MPIAPDAPAPLGDVARDLAFRRLSRQAVRFPDMEIGGLDDSHASMRTIDDRDAAFAHAIYDAGVRRWLTLRALLAPLTSQPFDEMEARVRGALFGAAAQIAFLDRVPVHAVINHAVEWCKVRIRPGAGAVANAVLRRFAAIVLDEAGEKRREAGWQNGRDELPLGDGTSLRLREAVLPEDELERLGVATSCPIELIGAWRSRWELADVVRLAQHGLASPPTVLNLKHARADARGLLEGLVTPHASASHAVFTGSRVDLRRILSSRDDVWVQDAGASGAVDSVADLPIKGGLIVDLCAGQGTKTRQLLHTFPEASIVATDVDGPRRETLERVFANHERVRVLPMKQLRAECLEKADLVLLDVPCSNTGVLARRPEAKYRCSSATIESLTNVQRQIIADTIPLVSRGSGAEGARGRILYSTCSLEQDENDAIAGAGGWAAKWHSFAPSRVRRELPRGGPGQDASEYQDGAYSALLE